MSSQKQLPCVDSSVESSVLCAQLVKPAASAEVIEAVEPTLTITRQDVLALAEKVAAKERPSFPQNVALRLAVLAMGFVALLTLLFVAFYIVQAVRDPAHTSQYREGMILSLREVNSSPWVTMIISMSMVFLFGNQLSRQQQQSAPVE